MQVYFETADIQIFHGHVLDVLRQMPDHSVNCCVTSPPYWGLRDYGIPPSVWGGDSNCKHDWTDASWKPSRWGPCDDDNPGDKQQWVAGSSWHVKRQSACGICGAWLGCFGLEPTPEMYAEHAVEIFNEVRRVLRDDGTLWLNIGDSYANGTKWGGTTGGKHVSALHGEPIGREKRFTGLKGKDLCGIPWMLAFALRSSGWYLRQDIIWHKPNPMPESVTDRCTKAHEYIFLMSKSQRYHYDQEATLEPTSPNTNARLSQKVEAQIGSERANGGQKTNGNMKAVGHLPDAYKGSLPGRKDGPGQDRRSEGERGRKLAEEGSGIKSNDSFSNAVCCLVEKRNKRSVWTVATESFSEAHFATFPTELIKPCILAGCPAGGTVLDPFAGSGTTMQVARSLHCKSIGIELNPEYIEIAKRRLRQDVLDFNQ